MGHGNRQSGDGEWRETREHGSFYDHPFLCLSAELLLSFDAFFVESGTHTQKETILFPKLLQLENFFSDSRSSHLKMCDSLDVKLVITVRDSIFLLWPASLNVAMSPANENETQRLPLIIKNR